VLAREILVNPELWVNAKTHTVPPVSRIKRAHLDKLIEADILIPLQGEQVCAWGLLTAVPEEGKGRYRMISDMLWSNATLADQRKVEFRDYRVLADALGKTSYAATADFQAWYYQLPVGVSVRPYLAVNVGGVTYSHARGPMGHKWMVFVAHTLTKVLAWDPDVFHDVIIDNVLYAGTEREVTKAMERFDARCSLVGQPTSQRMMSPASDVVEHRGLLWKLHSNVAVLKRTWVTRAHKRVDAFLSNPTAGKAWSLGGMVAWSRKMGLGADDFELWRDLARHSGGYGGRKLSLSQATMQAWKRWINWLDTEPQLELASTMTRCRTLLITDASLARPLGRWGAIVVSDHVQTYTGLFPIALCHVATIADLEAAAIVMALSMVRKSMDRWDVVCLTDNQAVAWAYRKGRSRAWRLHHLLRKIKEMVMATGSTCQLTWIATENNPADGLSRAFDITDKDANLTADLLRKNGMEMEEGTVTKEILNKTTKIIPVQTTSDILIKLLSTHCLVKGKINLRNNNNNVRKQLVSWASPHV
jgi:hypothetical protein